MNIVVGALEFPIVELKEKEKTLSHIDLVLYHLPIEVLYGLQMSITQEIQVSALSKSMELTKAITDRDALKE
jgi:hypothetical protein